MLNVNDNIAVFNLADGAAAIILAGKASDCSLAHIQTLREGFDLASGKVKHYAQAACYAAVVIRCQQGEQAVDSLKARQGLGAQIAKALSSANGLIRAGIGANQLIDVLEKLRDSGKFSAVQQSTTAAISAIQKAGLWNFADEQAGEQTNKQASNSGEQTNKQTTTGAIAPSEADRAAVMACELVGHMSLANFVLLATAVADRIASDQKAQEAIHTACVEREKAAKTAKAARDEKEAKEAKAARSDEEAKVLQALLLASNKADVDAQIADAVAKQYGKRKTKEAVAARQHAAELHAAAMNAGKAYQEAAQKAA